MTDKPLEQILEEFMQHCAEERRLDSLKKSGNELKRLRESLISSRIYSILDACSAQKYLNRSEHHEIRRLVRALISKYPSFIEQHGQELDRRLVTRAKKDLILINNEMHDIKSQAREYEQQVLEKNKYSKEIRDACSSLWKEFKQVYNEINEELAWCDSEARQGRMRSLRKARALQKKWVEIGEEIKKHQREAEQMEECAFDIEQASDRFTARKEAEIGKLFILGKLNADFLMGETYKERLEYLTQSENDRQTT